MGKKGEKQKGPVVTSGHQSGITLREESRGRKQTKGGSNNVKSIASCEEAMGTLPDPSQFPCQRCESILQPGHNCTVRLEKNRAKVRCQRRKLNISTQNNVVYKCHFCSHCNLKRGTPKGHMKEICPPKAKPSLHLEPANSMLQKSASMEKCTRSKV